MFYLLFVTVCQHLPLLIIFPIPDSSAQLTVTSTSRYWISKPARRRFTFPFPSLIEPTKPNPHQNPNPARIGRHTYTPTKLRGEGPRSIDSHSSSSVSRVSGYRGDQPCKILAVAAPVRNSRHRRCGSSDGYHRCQSRTQDFGRLWSYGGAPSKSIAIQRSTSEGNRNMNYAFELAFWLGSSCHERKNINMGKYWHTVTNTG